MQMFARRPLPVLLLAALPLASPAWAQDAEPAEVRGHYDTDAIPGRSSVFKSIGESSARTFEAVEGTLQKTDGSLAKMDLSVALARGAVDGGAWDLSRAQLDARSETFAYEFKGIQARFDQVGAAYEDAFGAALERAVAVLGEESPGAIIPCAETAGSALGALAGPGAAAPKAKCPGTDFTQEIARRWDGDTVLEERLLDVVGGDLGPLVIGVGPQGAPIEYGAPLDARGWPAITGYTEPAGSLAVGGQGGSTWVHPADLTVAFPELAEALDRIDALAATARAVLSAAAAALPRDDVGRLLQDDATLARVEAIQIRAKAIRVFTEDQRAAVGALLWTALNKGRKKGKKDGWSGAGLCLNPPAFGGCEGADVTDVVADFLGGDKKLQAALTALMDELSAPAALE